MTWKKHLVRFVHVFISLIVMLPLLLCPSTLNETVFGDDNVAIGVTYLALFFTSLVAYLIASCLDPGYLTHENARLFRHRRGQWSVGGDSKSEVGDLCDRKCIDEQECQDPAEFFEIYEDVANDAHWNYFTRLKMDCLVCPNPCTMFSRDTKFSTTYEYPVIALSVPVRFCRRCLLEQPLRCRHCPQCNRCVIKFDHHCPWITNCVGERNHCAFVMFLISQVAVLWWTVYFAWSSIIPSYVWTDWFRVNGLYLAEIVVLVFIGVPLTVFLTFHTYLALASRTTWETVAYEQIAYLRSLNERTNPFNQGCARNCYAFCCSPYPFGWDRIYADALGQNVYPTHVTNTTSQLCSTSHEPPTSTSCSTPEISPILFQPPSTFTIRVV